MPTDAQRKAVKNYYTKNKKKIFKRNYERKKELMKWGKEHELKCLGIVKSSTVKRKLKK